MSSPDTRGPCQSPAEETPLTPQDALPIREEETLSRSSGPKFAGPQPPPGISERAFPPTQERHLRDDPKVESPFPIVPVSLRHSDLPQNLLSAAAAPDGTPTVQQAAAAETDSPQTIVADQTPVRDPLTADNQNKDTLRQSGTAHVSSASVPDTARANPSSEKADMKDLSAARDEVTPPQPKIAIDPDRTQVTINDETFPITPNQVLPNSGYEIHTYNIEGEPLDKADASIYKIKPHEATTVTLTVNENVVRKQTAISGSGWFVGVRPADGAFVIFDVGSNIPDNPLITQKEEWVGTWIAGSDGLEVLEVTSPPYGDGENPTIEREVTQEEKSVPPKFWDVLKRRKDYVEPETVHEPAGMTIMLEDDSRSVLQHPGWQEQPGQVITQPLNMIVENSNKHTYGGLHSELVIQREPDGSTEHDRFVTINKFDMKFISLQSRLLEQLEIHAQEFGASRIQQSLKQQDIFTDPDLLTLYREHGFSVITDGVETTVVKELAPPEHGSVIWSRELPNGVTITRVPNTSEQVPPGIKEVKFDAKIGDKNVGMLRARLVTTNNSAPEQNTSSQTVAKLDVLEIFDVNMRNQGTGTAMLAMLETLAKNAGAKSVEGVVKGAMLVQHTGTLGGTNIPDFLARRSYTITRNEFGDPIYAFSKSLIDPEASPAPDTETGEAIPKGTLQRGSDPNGLGAPIIWLGRPPGDEPFSPDANIAVQREPTGEREWVTLTGNNSRLRIVKGELFGAGSQADVYSAAIIGWEENYVIKVPVRPTQSDINEFAKVAGLLAQFDHPNITRLVLSDTTRDLVPGIEVPIIVMQKAEMTLGQAIRESLLPIEDALQLAVHTASAYAAVHEKGLLMSGPDLDDVLLFREKGRNYWKFFDFDDVKPIEATREYEQRAYNPEEDNPETYEWDPAVAEQVDWAVNLIYPTLTGTYIDPERDIPPLENLLDTEVLTPYHRALESVLKKATTRRPKDRYPSMAALRDDLQKKIMEARRKELGLA